MVVVRLLHCESLMDEQRVEQLITANTERVAADIVLGANPPQVVDVVAVHRATKRRPPLPFAQQMKYLTQVFLFLSFALVATTLRFCRGHGCTTSANRSIASLVSLKMVPSFLYWVSIADDKGGGDSRVVAIRWALVLQHRKQSK